MNNLRLTKEGQNMVKSKVKSIPKELKLFVEGENYFAYEYFGAHKATKRKKDGVIFRVWAPNAKNVSVVGDFNGWEVNASPASPVAEGVWEVFIPDVSEYSAYKYAIIHHDGSVHFKADPYAFHSETDGSTASKVYFLDGCFKWSDDAWLKKRADIFKPAPMNIYEVHVGSWKMHADGNPLSYRDLADELIPYVKDMGYTHLELMPITEYPLPASWGYQVTGYYSPTSRYGTPNDFMYFINYMHKKGIGVILDWVPAHFPRDLHGLACFDGSHVYEHPDPRRGTHPHWGTLIYNYARPQVSNFLIANALFWAEKYHVDGIRMDAVASMLYLDYGKNAGEWLPNIYGGNENLDAIEFLKHLNSIYKKKHPSSLLIAEESTAWPKITGALKEGGLGFDYKWNMGWMNDFLEFMKLDPYFRSGDYNALTFSLLYAYSENFILVLSHDEVVHGKATLAGKMPGATQEEKFNNLRVAYGYMMTHPGKKLLFMGQEFGQMDEWNEDVSLEWNLLEYENHKKMQRYSKALNKLYLDCPALYKLDYNPDGFEWINCTSKDETIVVFLRKTEKPEDTLLVVCNFTPVVYEREIGVPYKGIYTEIFNSDDKKFGGSGVGNRRAKKSVKKKTDGREDSLKIKIPPMAMIVFKWDKQ